MGWGGGGGGFPLCCRRTLPGWDGAGGPLCHKSPPQGERGGEVPYAIAAQPQLRISAGIWDSLSAWKKMAWVWVPYPCLQRALKGLQLLLHHLHQVALADFLLLQYSCARQLLKTGPLIRCTRSSRSWPSSLINPEHLYSRRSCHISMCMQQSDTQNEALLLLKPSTTYSAQAGRLLSLLFTTLLQICIPFSAVQDV